MVTVPIVYQYSKANSHERIALLKPHGSINWFKKKAILDAHLSETIELDSKIHLVEFPQLLYSRDLINATPVIVPPVSPTRNSHGTPCFEDLGFGLSGDFLRDSANRSGN